ncbi:DUF4249 domain-containing protein [Flagellimonas pelagia]|uniref:DUF4249 domain-containing protein n=1 Tax=Flagellimonas pelagia TaxID=2306998 RepID=A0A3A1NNW9_9FLAO|nr:DUF4249 domain-containing protein [Allomuricauda maritima]RIV46974.1 DUF4249 domain-containing protein [Allomuricauda maritima]TXJ99863.1 DUF4249 domain-containing protein [Allomuricauda maritima]
MIGYRHIYVGGVLFLMMSCVEPFDAASEISSAGDLEGTLIVEANITDVEKTQKVYLSRMQRVANDSTVNVEEDRLFNVTTPILVKNGLGTDYESGAQVQISDSNGNIYQFEETEDGTYESLQPFAATANNSYRLSVVTVDGEEYVSEEMEPPGASIIDDLYVEKMVSDTGVEGVGIFVDASFTANGSKLLRYNYEETYKIIAPMWTPYEFEIIRDENEYVYDDQDNVIDILYPDVSLVPRAREEQVCYKTDPSNEEVLLNGNILTGSSTTHKLVRFVAMDNPIISHRYSILLKQMGISARSYEFYERLIAFSQNESLFSQIQPGTLEGNVSDIDGNTSVIGYFDVSSEVSQRLYFNFVDLFPDEPLPPYFGTVNCDNLTAPVIPNPDRDGPPPPDLVPCPQSLIERIKLGLVEYYQGNSDPPGECEGPYIVVPTICGDCNIVGSNIKPDFWID